MNTDWLATGLTAVDTGLKLYWGVRDLVSGEQRGQSVKKGEEESRMTKLSDGHKFIANSEGERKDRNFWLPSIPEENGNNSGRNQNETTLSRTGGGW